MSAMTICLVCVMEKDLKGCRPPDASSLFKIRKTRQEPLTLPIHRCYSLRSRLAYSSAKRGSPYQLMNGGVDVHRRCIRMMLTMLWKRRIKASRVDMSVRMLLHGISVWQVYGGRRYWRMSHNKIRAFL